MDPSYAANRPTRSHLDCERRRPLHFAVSRDAGLPAHHWHCAGLALHRRSRLHHHRYHLRHHALRYGAVAAYCADFAACLLTGMEHVGALRDVSPACGTEWVLWLQRIAADCLFHSRLCLRSFSDSYRDLHVSRYRESLSLVRAHLWREPIGQIDPLPDHAQLFRIHHRTCHFDRGHGIRAEYESYSARYRRARTSGQGHLGKDIWACIWDLWA